MKSGQSKSLPAAMRAMVLEHPKQPLVLSTLPAPRPAEDQVLIRVIACGICRTDLHVVDGELTSAKLPLVRGHEVVGRVVSIGTGVEGLHLDDLVGVPWLGYTCGICRYCRAGQENLCDNSLFTGYTLDGGYAEYMVANAKFCFPLDALYGNPSGAPLMCAGLIGHRSYSMVPPSAEHIGLYGFGAAAHILVQLAKYQATKISAFARDGAAKAVAFAFRRRAFWPGGSAEPPPEKLDAAILFAPVGPLAALALKATGKGGLFFFVAIHMSNIPSFPYDL